MRLEIKVGETKSFWGNKPILEDHYLPTVTRIVEFAEIVLREKGEL
jgi:hypothetical protein